MDSRPSSSDPTDSLRELYRRHGPPAPLESWHLSVPCSWGRLDESFEVVPSAVLLGRPGGSANWTFLTFSRPSGFLAPLCILWWPPSGVSGTERVFAVVPLAKLMALVAARPFSRVPRARAPELAEFRVTLPRF